MNVFAKFDEIPSMILKVIKETKRYGHKDGRSDVKTVYPLTNTVCGGYNYIVIWNIAVYLASLIFRGDCQMLLLFVLAKQLTPI